MAERGFAGGKVAISHCHNLALAEKLRDGIKELWNTADVGILPTRGLCSYYAERGGLIVSFTGGVSVFAHRRDMTLAARSSARAAARRLLRAPAIFRCSLRVSR